MPSSYPSAQLKPQLSPLSPASFLARLISGVVLLNLFLFILVGLSIQYSHRQYQERSEITTQNLTQTLESEIAGAIKTEDLALFAVMDEYQHQRSAGAVDGKALNAYLERVRSRQPEINALGITNAQGMIIYGIDVKPGATTSLADRPYFIQLHGDPKAGWVISKPLLSRFNQKWVIAVARRIDQPDGSFGGMVFATIALEYLSHTFFALNVGAHGAVVLRDEDLGIVVRRPEPKGVGSIVGSNVVAPKFREMIAAGNSTGTFMAHGGVDNIVRTYSYRKVGAYPFYILVGLAAEDYLSAWRDKATEQAALAALFTLISSWTAWLIYRAWKRQGNLELEKEKYLRFFQLSADLMCIADPFGCFTQVNPAFIRQIGYSESELIAKPFLEFTLPEDRQKTADEMKLQVSVRPSLNFENRFLCKDGATVFLAWTAYFDKSDGVTYAIARDITEHKRDEEALRENEEMLRVIDESAQDAILMLDNDGNIVLWNAAAQKMFGYSSSEVLGKQLHLLLAPARLREAFSEGFRHFRATGEGPAIGKTLELAALRKGGTEFPIELSISAVKLKGRWQAVGIVRDITERKQTELALLKSKQMYDKLVAKIPVGIYILRTTPEGIYTLDYASPRLAEILNTSVRNLLADVRALFQMIHPDDLDGFVKLNQDGIQLRRPFDWKGRGLIEGVVKWIHIESSPEAQEDGVVLWHGLVTDITVTKQMEEEVRQLAFYDPLTKLANRRLLNDRLSQSMSASKRSGFYSALMFLDLDNFKPINDTHGHVAGDFLLIEVASRLKNCVREMDAVARVGGDEFVVLLNNLNLDKVESTSQAEIVAEKIRITLSQPYLLAISHDEREEATVEHHCSASIGVVVFINHEASQEDILQRADAAMYAAKNGGRNRVVVDQHGNSVVWAAAQSATILGLSWHDSYDCGEPMIDQEHRQLFELANTLINAAFKRESNPHEFEDALKKLLAHVVTHFADEEAILARHHYADLDVQVRAHKMLIEHALRLRDAAAAGGVTIGELVDFLADEVVERHMLKLDREFYPLFKTTLPAQTI